MCKPDAAGAAGKKVVRKKVMSVNQVTKKPTAAAKQPVVRRNVNPSVRMAADGLPIEDEE